MPRLNVTLVLGVSCVEEVQSEEKNSWILPSIINSQQQVTEILYMCPCSCLQGNCLIILVIVIFCQAVLNCLCTIKQNVPTFLGVFLSVIYLWVDKIGPVHAMEACGEVGV